MSSNATSAFIQTSDSFTWAQITSIHGACMWVAWVFSPFIGIYIARYCKSWGHKWFIIHLAFLGLLTGAATLAGFALIFLYRPAPHFSGDGDLLQDVHVKLGLAMVLALLLQVILGFLAHMFYNPEERSANPTKVPIIDQFHRWFGRLLFLAGLAEVYMGAQIFTQSNEDGLVLDSSLSGLNWIFCGAMVLLYISAEFKKNMRKVNEGDEFDDHHNTSHTKSKTIEAGKYK